MREQQYVGIDLHRRRSVIVRMNDAGEMVGVSKIDNDPLALSLAIAEAGPDPEVERILKMVESGDLSAQDADELLRAMGRV